jgi:plastocyanin
MKYGFRKKIFTGLFLSVLYSVVLFGIALSGTITGIVKLPDKIVRPSQQNTSSISKRIMQSMETEFDNVVVYIEKTVKEQPYLTTSSSAVMDMKNQTYIPHVLPILVNTTVDFLNDDDFYHHPFSFSKTKSFDLDQYAKPEKRPVVFNKTGIVDVYCQIYPDMQAFILVLQNPYFTKPDSMTGSYSISFVPAGHYTLIAWHDFLKPVKCEIDVPEKGEIQINFQMAKK